MGGMNRIAKTLVLVLQLVGIIVLLVLRCVLRLFTNYKLLIVACLISIVILMLCRMSVALS